LFTQVDKIDRDGSIGSMRLVDKDGKATEVAPKVAVIGDLGKAASLQRKARAADRGNDDVLFIGMRKGSSVESQQMKSLGIGGKFSVTVIGSDKSTVDSGGKTYDLSKADDRKAFSQSLGLSK